MASYESIAGLDSVYLEDSFVLAVCVRPCEVEFIVDVVLKRSHPQYSAPREHEQYCYRRGRLRFEGVQEVNWLMGSVEPAYDAEGEIDYGGFDQFEVLSDRFVVTGDFGRLKIEAARCDLTLDGA